MQSCFQTSPLFLITYIQNGLLMRDNYYHEADAAQRHCLYLQQLFPDAQVQLHTLSFESKKRSDADHSSHFTY